MPIAGAGYEFHVVRLRSDRRASDGKMRTIGRYRVFHDGVEQRLFGAIAEARRPGDNDHTGNNRCIEPGRYPLLTQDGEKYVTIGYKTSSSPALLPKPGLLIGKTKKRVGILIHPGVGFLSSIGCFNPTRPLKTATDLMDFAESRDRVIAIIEDLMGYLGKRFPKQNGKPIPDASVVVDDDL